MTFMNLLFLPFQFNFMINALAVSVLVAVPMALLSCFLVLKGWSLIGDAISHAVFPGVVLSYIIGLPYSIGAFSTGLFSAIATGFLKNNSRIKQDTAMGIVFSGMFGLGLVLYVNISSSVHLSHILFGDMLGVSQHDVKVTAIIAIVTASIIIVKWKDFLLHTFDQTQACIAGLQIKLLHYGLLSLISLTIVNALQSVGIVLSVALLVSPGAIAFLLSRKFSTMLFLALGIALFGSFTGVYLSFFIDSAPAPTIVLFIMIIFLCVFIHTVRKEKKIVGRIDL
ncbi:MAG: manganese/iron transport system permease protein [Candidatus Tokpelaia sp. JSC085]|nr:MAG: manganese/iron transport system permease protein [Candidatus Tokpelaia sp. JSC085]